MSYQSHGEVSTTSPWWTKEMNHTTQVPAKERVVVADDETSGLSSALQFKQKVIVSMKNVIGKFPQLGQTFVDPSAGTFATGNV